MSNYLERITANYKPLENQTLGVIGDVLEKDAKEKFGHYQRGIDFQEWQELADSTKADRVRQGYAENEPLLREGDLRDSIHHLVTLAMNNLTVYSDSEIMVYQELGTAHIPPRSVLGLTAFESVDIVKPILKEMLIAWVTDQKITKKIS